MAVRSRVSRSKSPKRAASRSRSASKKAMKRSASKKAMKRSASKKAMKRRSASKKAMRRSRSASRKTRMTRKPRMVRRTNAYANFRKANWMKVKGAMPGATFAQVSRVVAEMWKKAGSKTKSAVRKMVRSPRKVRKMRMSKKRALKKSGSPRKARKDKGKKGTRKANAYAMFVKKYFGAKRAALGGNAQPKMVMKSLGNDWKQGVRSY
jgi:hypothetical protein